MHATRCRIYTTRTEHLITREQVRVATFTVPPQFWLPELFGRLLGACSHEGMPGSPPYRPTRGGLKTHFTNQMYRIGSANRLKFNALLVLADWHFTAVREELA